jgi:exonuclease III
MLQKNIHIEAIAIQETWDIRLPELVNIPNFKPILFKKRRDMRGGGVGIYIRNYLNGTVIDHLSPFENKIFESITIQLTYPTTNRSILLTSAYRSNGIIRNVTPQQQMERFLDKFGELVSQLQQTRKESYIFIDANINLLDMANQNSLNYMNVILGNGFLQGVFKATRMQNNSKTLLDHILFNNTDGSIDTGTLVSEVSDHFFTFVCARSRETPRHEHKEIVARDFNPDTLRAFKLDLAAANWENVLAHNNVDSAYDAFWNIYNDCYNNSFPVRRKRFDKNFHPKNRFMTHGLLVSRQTLKRHHRESLINPSAININRYKTFKTVYHRTLRGAKKLYFASKLNEHASSPKKHGKL